MSKNLFRLLFVLWAGSLWSTVWVALILFYSQPDRHLAGTLAAKLFSVETYLGLAVVLLGLALRLRARLRAACLAAGLLLVNEWAFKPLMDHARLAGTALGLGFGAWHGISALFYLTACLAVLWQASTSDTLGNPSA